MFGLEKQKKSKKADEFIFDLEKDLKGINGILLRKKLDEREQQFREVLRQGEEKEDFDKFGVLLYGYAAMKKVFSRVEQKS